MSPSEVGAGVAVEVEVAAVEVEVVAIEAKAEAAKWWLRVWVGCSRCGLLCSYRSLTVASYAQPPITRSTVSGYLRPTSSALDLALDIHRRDDAPIN